MKKDLYELASENKTLLSATIELTTRCNWRCKHCYIPEYTQKGLSAKELDKLFDDLRRMGTFELVFTGGEIFMRKDAMEIIENARAHFFDVKLFTNVSLLDEEKIKRLAKIHISQISCTLFSLQEEIHDHITTVKGSLHATLKNLALLKKYGISVEVKQILMNINQDCLEEIVAYCSESGFKHLATTNIFYQTDGQTKPANYRVDNNYLQDKLVQIDEIRNFMCFSKNDSMYVCNATRCSCTIEANGNYLACNNLNLPLDNILDTSIHDIWKDNVVLQKIQAKKQKDLGFCNACSVKEYCARCSRIALLEDKDLWGCSTSSKILAKVRFDNKDKYDNLEKINHLC
ncbi:radical SAM/SPASM domain-containing protein [Lactococcus nasutitermitis]|uniref:Radical SAM/SPASM domain-containing protein n=2 Tax=Lactococcus nasutitermitis TaxID=1652957 RepID=A0ABV9JIG3_9LACT